ncbi:hypothetical protein LTR10_011665 [Elasticomyces elasticus]|uniref:ribonuclease T1 n=1 Tax=Exophiala sideris TaxID=1016849 RepID=A0ABR0JD41_9EURO|nr:hypothetical protein LTR10_011665 [Elasticomyces elasticus]KAK5031876.1 hypothetical protein LTS07_004497 [Exophiala sideris]KAK5040805.1 hypothetical protein LTR13_003106 [Exophiala sideris]KAK5061859.1 hypothetical protein LTR69_005043 [Exophiala sideris]KAK5184559.1 hypothetical protein LTR44_003234 [Eurotiomycetes sp. CCFEE 6388]
MHVPQILASCLFALSPVFARPGTLNLAKRQSCVDTCGSTCYWQSDIDAALQQGFSFYQQGTTVGKDEYPHEFDDREGFDITVWGPWYEFPILNSYEVYTGGSPGADRVVFTRDGTLALVVTHTGATDDNFVECSGAQP